MTTINDEQVFICVDCEKKEVESVYYKGICDKCRHERIKQIKRSIEEDKIQLEILEAEILEDKMKKKMKNKSKKNENKLK